MNVNILALVNAMKFANNNYGDVATVSVVENTRFGENSVYVDLFFDSMKPVTLHVVADDQGNIAYGNDRMDAVTAFISRHSTRGANYEAIMDSPAHAAAVLRATSAF